VKAVITPLESIGPRSLGSAAEGSGSTRGPVTAAQAAETFGQALLRALERVNAQQQQADRAAEAFALGENRDVAQLMIATEQARLALELTVQIRNKVLEAYQEIMRIQV